MEQLMPCIWPGTASVGDRRKGDVPALPYQEAYEGSMRPLLRDLGFGDRIREDRYAVKLSVKVRHRRQEFVVGPVMGRDETWNMFQQYT